MNSSKRRLQISSELRKTGTISIFAAKILKHVISRTKATHAKSKNKVTDLTCIYPTDKLSSPWTASTRSYKLHLPQERKNFNSAAKKLKHVIWTTKLPKLKPTKRSIPWPASTLKEKLLFRKKSSPNFLSRPNNPQGCHIRNSNYQFFSPWTTSTRGYKLHQQKLRQI